MVCLHVYFRLLKRSKPRRKSNSYVSTSLCYGCHLRGHLLVLSGRGVSSTSPEASPRDQSAPTVEVLYPKKSPERIHDLERSKRFWDHVKNYIKKPKLLPRDEEYKEHIAKEEALQTYPLILQSYEDISLIDPKHWKNKVKYKLPNQKKLSNSQLQHYRQAIKHIENIVFGINSNSNSNSNGTIHHMYSPNPNASSLYFWKDICQDLIDKQLMTNPKHLQRLQKLILQMPHIEMHRTNRRHISPKGDGNGLVSENVSENLLTLQMDRHITKINFGYDNSNTPLVEWYNMIDWDKPNPNNENGHNQSHVQLHSRSFHKQNGRMAWKNLNDLKHLLKTESKVILSRGLDRHLDNGYETLLYGRAA
ncbi:hypothetical protein RFI_10887, partial [Reticulomyxa filosa]